MKRTPGNWFVAHDSRGFAVETERVRIVNLGHSDECAEADAYLMAAAPAMLEALEYAQRFERNRGGSWAEFKAIIDGAVATAVRHNV